MCHAYIIVLRRLESSSDIDEGVDMGGDVDSSTSSDNTQELLLHISPDLKSKFNVKSPLPQILVPK